MAKCDLCGGHCRANDLAQLLDQYQAAGVVDICPSCTKWTNKQKSDMLDEIAPRMRAAIAARKGAQPQAPRAPWWRRVFGAMRMGIL